MSEETRGRRTELDDLERSPLLVPALFQFVRDARLFSARGLPVLQGGEGERRVARLAPNELFRPPVPSDTVVRLGQLRVSEFLPDGREVARAVLQAGSLFRARPWPDSARKGAAPGGDGEASAAAARADAPAAPPAPWSNLAYIVLMALDEAELWILPAGALDEVRLEPPSAAAGEER